MKRRLQAGVAALGLMLTTEALAAQPSPPRIEPERPGEEPTEAEMAGLLKAMFAAEPLTAEQRARLPQAEAVIARMMPPGTSAKWWAACTTGCSAR